MRDASQSADAADADLAWSVFDRRGGEGGREWQSQREVAAQLPVSPPPSLSPPSLWLSVDRLEVTLCSS